MDMATLNGACNTICIFIMATLDTEVLFIQLLIFAVNTSVKDALMGHTTLLPFIAVCMGSPGNTITVLSRITAGLV